MEGIVQSNDVSTEWPRQWWLKMMTPNPVTPNPVLDVSLREVLRPEIALTLEYLLKIYTVGNLLRAWKSPSRQRNIEQLFDTPNQARHAAQVCATWLGVPIVPTPQDNGVHAWWSGDEGASRRYSA